jgi:uncharacterized protein YbaR (Trm112 family)
MFIELIDLLRCPVEHDETWLVAAFAKMDGRFVIEGKLGCPVCSASFPITSGVARFDARGVVRPEVSDARPFDDPDYAIRIAAMLDLTRPGMTVVLEGASAEVAKDLVEIAGSRVVTVNAHGSIKEAEGVAGVTAGNRLPLGTASVDGIVVGPDSTFSLTEAIRVVKRAGRLVGPSSMTPVAGTRELARDDRNVVLESVGELVTLKR